MKNLFPEGRNNTIWFFVILGLVLTVFLYALSVSKNAKKRDKILTETIQNSNSNKRNVKEFKELKKMISDIKQEKEININSESKQNNDKEI